MSLTRARGYGNAHRFSSRPTRDRFVTRVNGSNVGHRGFVSSLLAGLGALAIDGCFSPAIDIPRCTVECSSDVECPPDFACSAGYCDQPGTLPACVVAAGGGVNDPRPPAPAPMAQDAGPADVDEPRPEVVIAPSDAGSGSLGGASDSDPPVVPAPRDPCAAATGIAIAPCVLQQPCRDLPYAVTFTPTDTALAWEAPTLPSGLALDAATLTVSGIARDSGELVLEGKDARGQVVQRARFELGARTSCSVAFVVDEGSGARLHLADREQLATVPEVVLPLAPTAGESVVDFQFSPDGRSLLVRVADSAGGNRLTAYSAPDWRERALPALAGSVLQYAWSLDGSAVAAVLLTVDGIRLGGFALPSIVTESSDSVLTAFAMVATPGDTRPVWFTEQHVGFLSGEGPSEGGRQLLSATLGASGFSTPVAETGARFSEDELTLLRLEGNEQGLLLYSAFLANPTLVELFRPDGAGVHDVTQGATAIPSPDARYSALANGGELRVQLAHEQPLQTFATVIATATGCNALLAWSPASDRVVCVTDGAAGGNLRAYDFDGRVLSEPRPVEGAYVYSEAIARFRRRAFSPGGRWLTFGNDFQQYFVDLRDERLLPQPTPMPIDASAQPEYAFSPDDRLLVRHQGDRIAVRYLAEQGQSLLAERVAPSLPCDEHLARSSRSYCGSSTSSTSQVSWASDSRSFLFANTAGELQLMRVLPSADSAVVDLDPVALRPDCAAGCLGQFALQP